MCIYDVYGPCSCPHGRCFTVLAQCFTVSSWVSSFLAVTSCFYMYVRPIPAEGEAEQPKEGFGFLARQAKLQEPPSYSDCVYWDGEETDEYFDSMWKAGKAMGIIAVGVGFIVMCIVMCTCCVAYQLPTFDGLFWTCMFCFAAQCLSFLSWGSDLCDDMECTWAPGSGTNISAAMLWIWAANMVKSFPEALPARGRGQRGANYEDDDEYYEDSPYLDPNGGFDEDYYDYGDEESWQPEQDYDGYDDSTYGGYDDNQDYDNRTYDEYGNDEYGDDYTQDDYTQGQEQYSQDDYTQGQYGDDTYTQDDYTQGQYGDEQYSQDDYTQDQYGDDYYDGDETYDGSSGNNFYQSDPSDSNARMSAEEREYLGVDSDTRSTMEDLD